MSNQDPKYSRVAQNKKSAQKKRRPIKPEEGKFKKYFKRFIIALILFLEIAIAAGATAFFIYAKNAPALTDSKLSSAGSTIIYDANDKKITSLGTQNRQRVESQDVPQQLKDAIVSIEDRRFYKHHGVDPVRIIGAALSNIKSPSEGLQGGSTLDQQLIKLSFYSTKRSDQTFKRKAQEAWLALKLDNTYSKDQILNFYINKVFMGYGTFGMQTAAHYYYGKPLNKLSLGQTAMIAGIPNAPSDYNPYSNPQLAAQRRNEVLSAMVANKKISSAQAAQAENEDVKNGLVTTHQSQQTSQKAKIADAYIKEVINDAKKKGYDPYKDSLKIYTNIDMKTQEHLYDLANSNSAIAYPDDKLQVASTVVNPNNGKVVAMIGGRKTGDVTYGLNRAVQTDRTNGSTAKPLMDYGPAIEYLSWATYHHIKDTPYVYPGSNISLYDFDRSYKGSMTMRNAIIQSRNIPAIRALEAVGITKAQNFISKLGFNYSKTLEFQNGIGLPSSTLQNAAAYAAFANGGTYYKPSYINSIETNDGEIKNYSGSGKQVMQSSTAYMLTDMMKDVVTNSSGTGRFANISGLYQAGKTGTNSYPSDIASKFPNSADMDSWFNGYTKHYSISVWVGYDHPYEANNYLDTASSRIASYFYKYAMEDVSQGKTNTDWERPSNVLTKTVNGVRELYLAGSPESVAGDSSSSKKSSKSSSDSISSLMSSSSFFSDSSSEDSSSSEESSSSSSSSETSSSSSSSSEQPSSSEPSSSTSSTSSEEHSSSSNNPSSSNNQQTSDSGNNNGGNNNNQ